MNENKVTTQFPRLKEIYTQYDSNIGLEVHCQLAAEAKSFSWSANQVSSAPNTNIDPTCLGLPGALPVINERIVDLALRMGLALQCKINPVSIFARKNYFYPDLPKGYQITQYDSPICLDGTVTLSSGKVIRIERIQIEEDAGKNLHVGSASLVDYNRSGVGLIEIVSRPDISTPEEASEYLKILHNLVVHLDISDGNMEHGNFRMDANVSIRPKEQKQFGQRAEIKNVNSFKYIEKAIAYEIERQFDVITTGGRIVMETRGYDSEKNQTFSQRSKENANDYRYFPDPDLPPLIVTPERIEKVRKTLPELPEQKAQRFVKDFGLKEYDANVIASSRRNSAYFEKLWELVKGKVDTQLLCSYFMTEVLRAIKIVAEKQNTNPEDLVEVPFPVKHSQELLELISTGKISGRMAKDIFEESLDTGTSPEVIVSSKGLVQVSDDSEILKVIHQVFDQSPTQLADYLSGKDKLFGFFVGQSMKIGAGKLNPAKVNELLKQELDKKRSSR